MSSKVMNCSLGILALIFSSWIEASELTPLGAERNSSPDQGIPEWNDSLQWVQEKLPKLRAEQPLFTIDHTNLETYRNQLPDGLAALVLEYPDSFRVPVYPSYRTHRVPDYIYQAALKNRESSRLIDEGNGLAGAYPGPPFPEPDSALEVLWNHLIAWRGVYTKINFTEVLTYSSGESKAIETEMELSMPYYDINRETLPRDHIKMLYLSQTTAPPQLAGGALLVFDTLNQRLEPRKVWTYVAQQRRVKRMPFLSHDSVNPNSGLIRVVDEVDLFNGTPERYDWVNLGKQALIVPYNNEDMKQLNLQDLRPVHHLNINRTRFERHRVWVIEGRLKPGETHLYPRRRLYIDEDSWMALVAEQFDRDDELWRVSLSYTRYYPEMPGVWKAVDTFHDLKNHDHFSQGILATPTGKPPIEFYDNLPEENNFSPSRLRSVGRR